MLTSPYLPSLCLLWAVGLHAWHIQAMVSLLKNANPEHPLEADIAKQYNEQREEHDKTAQEWTAKYAAAE